MSCGAGAADWPIHKGSVPVQSAKKFESSCTFDISIPRIPGVFWLHEFCLLEVFEPRKCVCGTQDFSGSDVKDAREAAAGVA